MSGGAKGAIAFVVWAVVWGVLSEVDAVAASMWLLLGIGYGGYRLLMAHQENWKKVAQDRQELHRLREEATQPEDNAYAQTRHAIEVQGAYACPSCVNRWAPAQARGPTFRCRLCNVTWDASAEEWSEDEPCPSCQYPESTAVLVARLACPDCGGELQEAIAYRCPACWNLYGDDREAAECCA